MSKKLSCDHNGFIYIFLIYCRGANGRVIERALMDYLLITKRMVGRLKDVHVFRGVAAGMV